MEKGRPRALVVDDDADMLSSVADAVASLGVEVTCARNGCEFMERLADEPPFDFIVADVSMPWMTGLQALHSARTAGLRTPVVVMTALRRPEVVAQAARLGNRAVLIHKPFDARELRRAIRLAVSASPEATPSAPW